MCLVCVVWVCVWFVAFRLCGLCVSGGVCGMWCVSWLCGMCLVGVVCVCWCVFPVMWFGEVFSPCFQVLVKVFSKKKNL